MLRQPFNLAYWAIIVLFAVAAVWLIALAADAIWGSIAASGSRDQRFSGVLEAIGLLTVAVAALELSQTILDEEVRRRSNVSAPTRVRRFVSRFLVVVVVSLAIETLVLVFEFSHADPSQLPASAALGGSVGLLLAGWGIFLHFNRSAEQLEPEALEQTKREDAEVDGGR